MSLGQDQLVAVFKVCDTGSKGFLTASDLNKALDTILKEDDKMEIMKILGVLDSDQARVSLTSFQQKVLEFRTRKEATSSEDEDDFNDNREIEKIISQQTLNLQNLRLADNIMSPFHPKLNSSPLMSKVSSERLRRISLHDHEDTFESNGEGEDMSPISDPDEEPSFIRRTRHRVSFRGSRGFLRKNSISSSENLSSIDAMDADVIDKRTPGPEEILALMKHFHQKDDIIQRYEEELQNESNLIKSLEEKLSFLETTNKEISFQLENSRNNIKNLETHMIFLDEKNSNEKREVERERLKLFHDRDKLNEEKSRHFLREIQLKETMEEFEDWKAEILARNRILQAEILNLMKEKKKSEEDHRNVERVLRDKINQILLENISLKKKIMDLDTRIEVPQALTELTEKKSRRQLKRGKFKNLILGVILEGNLPELTVRAFLSFLYELFTYFFTD